MKGDARIDFFSLDRLSSKVHHSAETLSCVLRTTTRVPIASKQTHHCQESIVGVSEAMAAVAAARIATVSRRNLCQWMPDQQCSVPHGSPRRVHGLFGEQCTNISRGERKGMQCGEKCAIIPSMDDDHCRRRRRCRRWTPSSTKTITLCMYCML